LRLREEGTTIVLTTHYLEEAETLADRVAVIDGGRLVALDRPAQLLARHGRKRLRVTLGNRLAALPPALVELGARLAVDPAGSGSVVDCAVPEGDAGALLAAILGAGGGRIVDVDTERPSLEQVFLELVAR
jgi:ABC-2 type transport system ATP-binding protein